MKRSWDDAILCAYVDGELDLETLEEVEGWLARDAEAAQRVATMRRANSVLRAALAAPVEEPLPPRLQSMLALAMQQRPRRPAAFGTHSWMRLAASVLLALAVGVGGGQLWALRDAARLEASRQQESTLASVTLANALENNLSGDELQWRGTLATGKVVPLRTWQEPNGRYCREYRSETAEGTTRGVRLGVSCRRTEGGWVNRFEVIPAEDFALETTE